MESTFYLKYDVESADRPADLFIVLDNAVSD
jgi:hypothetical protein